MEKFHTLDSSMGKADNHHHNVYVIANRGVRMDVAYLPQRIKKQKSNRLISCAAISVTAIFECKVSTPDFAEMHGRSPPLLNSNLATRPYGAARTPAGCDGAARRGPSICSTAAESEEQCGAEQEAEVLFHKFSRFFDVYLTV